MSILLASQGPGIGNIPFELTSEIFLLTVSSIRHDPRRYHEQLDILVRVSQSWKTVVDGTADSGQSSTLANR